MLISIVVSEEGPNIFKWIATSGMLSRLLEHRRSILQPGWPPLSVPTVEMTLAVSRLVGNIANMEVLYESDNL